jgi:hypothetical protein
MSAHSPAGHPHGSLENPDTHHETSDINVRAIIWFVAVLSIVVLSMNAAMWAMFRVLDHFERKNQPYVTPLAPEAKLPKDFPAPSLQTTPWTDLRTFRAEQQNYLHGYGWVDEKLGVARIPIDKAKQLLLQRGMAVRPELADPTEGTHVAASGESNGGRTIPAGQADRSSVPSATPAAAPTAPAAAPAAPAPAVTKPGGGRP